MLLSENKVELVSPVILIIFAPILLIRGSSTMSSWLSPELERKITISFSVIIPRSPWLASPGCIKKDGVPVLEKVDAIFPAICPDFPIPLKITLPSQPRIHSTASENSFDILPLAFNISFASIFKTS